MTDSEHYKAVLQARREELRRRLRRIAEDLHRPGDPDLEDQAVQRQNDEVLEEMDGEAAAELTRIAAALERIRLGTYGRCISCGDEIATARLDAVPTASRCRECAR